jgi:hypothetical protein
VCSADDLERILYEDGYTTIRNHVFHINRTVELQPVQADVLLEHCTFLYTNEGHIDGTKTVGSPGEHLFRECYFHGVTGTTIDEPPDDEGDEDPAMDELKREFDIRESRAHVDASVASPPSGVHSTGWRAALMALEERWECQDNFYGFEREDIEDMAAAFQAYERARVIR